MHDTIMPYCPSLVKARRPVRTTRLDSPPEAAADSPHAVEPRQAGPSARSLGVVAVNAERVGLLLGSAGSDAVRSKCN